MAGTSVPASTIYLESYIESTGSLPPELQRILTTIQALDAKCLDLSESVHHSLAILLKPQTHGNPLEEAEYQEASNTIGMEQQLLLQFAEEKVQLAHRAHGLLEMHALDLEQSIDDFEGELRLSGALESAPSQEYFPPIPEAPVLPEREPPARERDSREREKDRSRSNASAASRPPIPRPDSEAYGLNTLADPPVLPPAPSLPLPTLPPTVLPKPAGFAPQMHRTASNQGFGGAAAGSNLPPVLAPLPVITPSLAPHIPSTASLAAFHGSAAPAVPSLASAASVADGGAPAPLAAAHWQGAGGVPGLIDAAVMLPGRESTGGHHAGGGAASKGKRPREEEPAAAALVHQQQQQQQHHLLQQPHHLAQLLGGHNVQPLLKKKISTAQVILPQAAGMAEVSTAANLDPVVNLTGEDPPPPDTVRFRRPPPRDFKDSATKPQAPGQFLGDADIGPGLIGRHAELWWPDDSLWYLIEIQEVDMASKRAKVLYSTGDIEELELEQTAKDRHMVLIGQQYYT
ncbi:MAG: hypothetical protein WDW38_005613 [Sanguina aurantia]